MVGLAAGLSILFELSGASVVMSIPGLNRPQLAATTLVLPCRQIGPPGCVIDSPPAQRMLAAMSRLKTLYAVRR